MKRFAYRAAVALLCLPGLDAAGLAISPAAAQMDWLTPNLEGQRHNNVRRHQQRIIKKRRQAQGQATTVARPDPARMAAHRRRLEPEYNRRVRLYGRAAANRWLKQKAFDIGVAEGRRARKALQ